MSIGKTSVEMLITNIYLWFWGIFVSPQEKVNNAVNYSIYEVFVNNYGFGKKFTTYLKESCGFVSGGRSGAWEHLATQ